MDALTLVAYLHAVTSDPWELVALIGPFAVVFGAGIMLVIMPIVRAGGERYQHREYRAEDHPPGNGNGSGPDHRDGVHATKDADEAATPARWKN